MQLYVKPRKEPRNSKLIKGTILVLLGLLAIFGVGYTLVKAHGLPKLTFLSNLLNRPTPKSEPPKPLTLCIGTGINETLTSQIEDWADSTSRKRNQEITTKKLDSTSQSSNACDLAVTMDQTNFKEDELDLAWKRYLAFVGYYNTGAKSLTWAEFTKLVNGGSYTLAGRTYKFVADATTIPFLTIKTAATTTILSSADVATYLMQHPNTLAVVPFENVTDLYRILEIDNSSLVYHFNENYPLIEKIYVKDKQNLGLFNLIQAALPPINFDPEKVISVVMTGTSVIGARGLYFKIQSVKDPLYPIRNVATTLGEADIAHISNEGTFSKSCTQRPQTMVFCGLWSSLQEYTYAGVDVVGLTGNHLLDYGPTEFIKTLNEYDKMGLKYFGAGRNMTDAYKPAIVEVKGVKFAFLGYNEIPPVSYFATKTKPGTAKLDIAKMTGAISSAKKKADFVIVDMSWGAEYNRKPSVWQRDRGHAAIQSGADIVNGVQSHVVMTMERYKGNVIFYGVGNLLFDQMWSKDTREGVMIRHYFYDKKYLGFEPIPTTIFEASQPRLTTGVDRVRIAGYLFNK